MLGSKELLWPLPILLVSISLPSPGLWCVLLQEWFLYPSFGAKLVISP